MKKTSPWVGSKNPYLLLYNLIILVIYNLLFIFFVLQYVVARLVFNKPLYGDYNKENLIKSTYYFLFGRKYKSYFHLHYLMKYPTLKLHFFRMKYMNNPFFQFRENSYNKEDLGEDNRIFITYHFLGFFTFDLREIAEHDRVCIVLGEKSFISKGRTREEADEYCTKCFHHGYFFRKNPKQAILLRSDDPLLYLKLLREMSRGSLVIMAYDVFDQWYKNKETLEKETDHRKAFIYKYKGENFIYMPSLLIKLMKKKNVKLVPVITRLTFGGFTRVKYGPVISYNQSGIFEKEGQRICNQLYDFLVENIRESPITYDGMEGLGVFMKENIAKPNKPVRAIDIFHDDYKLSSEIVINRLGKKKYLVTSLRPYFAFTVKKEGLAIIKLLKKGNRPKINQNNEKQVKKFLSILHQHGILEIRSCS